MKTSRFSQNNATSADANQAASRLTNASDSNATRRNQRCLRTINKQMIPIGFAISIPAILLFFQVATSTIIEQHQGEVVRNSSLSSFINITAISLDQAAKQQDNDRRLNTGNEPAATTILDVAPTETTSTKEPVSSGVNQSPTNNNNTTQNTDSQQPESTSNVQHIPAPNPQVPSASSSLRSMQEMASELSKKHLNLANENWRLKSANPSTFNGSTANSSSSQILQTTISFNVKDGEDANANVEQQPTNQGNNTLKLIETEQEEEAKNGSSRNGNFDDDTEGIIVNGSRGTLERDDHKQNLAVHENSSSPVEISSTYDPEASSYLTHRGSQSHASLESIIKHENDSSSFSIGGSAQIPRTRQPKASHVELSSSIPNLMNVVNDNQQHEGDEVLQNCHRYLFRFQAAYSQLPAVAATNLPGADWLRLSGHSNSGDQFPCSCERRAHFGKPASEQNGDTSVWLDCDHVQLVGGQLLGSNMSDHEYDYLEKENSSNKLMTLINSFSQRESGLQRINSQKFLELKLSNLRSIDLSSNRIRQIRVDAFHGLEFSLEYLNLANNLLGDFKSPLDSNSYDDSSSSQSPSSRSIELIFSTNELNKLRKLRWLSLRNNQISQLWTNLFVKLHPNLPVDTNSDQTLNSQSTNSELRHLDLSQNLLKIVPSNSIKQLDQLEHLDLSSNWIKQLDESSKFPRSIKYLDLSWNLIENVNQCDLLSLPRLRELNLAQNQIARLDKLAFVSQASIALSNNLILSLGSHVENLLPSRHQGGHYSPIRQRRDLSSSSSNEPSEDQESIVIERERDLDDERDLETDESIATATSHGVGAVRPSKLEAALTLELFNSTLALNLSGNLFEQIPGDILLKFPKLERLDLSNNRIRKLDTSYLCSTYNLVDSLRYLDLSGNLFQLVTSLNNNLTNLNSTATNGPQAPPAITVHRQLDKLFGCMQNLEFISLATNRLSKWRNEQEAGGDLSSESHPARELELASLDAANNLPIDEFDYLMAAESTIQMVESNEEKARLSIRFGDNHGSKNLQHIDLSDNQLTRMPVIELESFSHNSQQSGNLDPNLINNNRSTRANWVNGLLRLESLSLNDNQIERIEENELNNLVGLRNFQIRSNRISHLSTRAFRKFIALEQIYLAGNRIRSLSPLNELFEQSIRSLKTLDLANNRIQEWPQMMSSHSQYLHTGSYHKQATSDGPVSSSFALEELNLSSNLLDTGNVTTLFNQLNQLKQLKRLDLSYNLIARVKSEWFKYANRNLERLHLTGNRINSIELGAFAPNQVNELTQLHLQYNVLKELKRKTFDSIGKLCELDLGNNLIHTINSETFHQLNNLRILKLNNNKLTSWKCEYFSNLCNSITGNINADLSSLIQSADKESLQYNSQHVTTSYDDNSHQNHRLHSISTVSGLLELDLSHNSLSQLRTNSIAVHTRLVKLNLEHNKLSFIPHDLFRATISTSISGRQLQLISSLKYINLAHNRIQMIDNINFRPLKNLFSLDLSSNELQTLGTNIVATPGALAGKLIASSTNSKTTKPYQLDDFVDESSLLNQINQNNGTGNLDQQQSNRNLQAYWPGLTRLRHLNLANNQLTMLNQSLISELSPFTLLKLNLSSNYLTSDSLPNGFYTKISSSLSTKQQQIIPTHNNSNQGAPESSPNKSPLDLIFSLRIESLDLSHNRLTEMPAAILDTHFASMESCNLAFNRIQRVISTTNHQNHNQQHHHHHHQQQQIALIHIKNLNLEYNPLSRESSELLLSEQRNARSLNLAATRLYAIQQAILMSDQLAGLSSSGQHHQRSRLANQTAQLESIRSISRPIDAPYLQTLNLSSNQLVWLAANVFERTHHLRVLDLSNNQLTRLHLLNSQLAHVGRSLEHLNLASNLFTNIDSNDFSQLVRLRHLNLANLLSLNKLNCKFLSKLNSLSSLKLINYPQLRQSLALMQMTLAQGADHPSIITASNQHHNQTGSHKRPSISERLKFKLRNELIYSTIGRHCFRSHELDFGGLGRADEAGIITKQKDVLKWLKLSDLELELFNNYESAGYNSAQHTTRGGSFGLNNELSQLLGPQMSQLTLVGLNLTSISDESFLGISGKELKLRISYTSISSLPLQQVLTSVARRTRLSLDFRNNIIQTIDSKNLAHLDELMQQNMADTSGASIRLSSNPIRCDCQTRPLWLWLNQHWTSQQLATSSPDDETSGPLVIEPAPKTTDPNNNNNNHPNPVNYWLRLRSITQTSDLKCYYPAKLRGKLTQHVNYNELVCKPPVPAGSVTSSGSTVLASGRQSRKRANETLSASNGIHHSDSSSSSSSSSSSDSTPTSDDLSDDDGLELLTGSDLSLSEVHATKFNKYPWATGNENPLLYFNGLSIESDNGMRVQQLDRDEDESRSESLAGLVISRSDGSNSMISGTNLISRMGKRDQHSSLEKAMDPLKSLDEIRNGNRHKGNFHQRHSTFGETLNAFQKVPFGSKAANTRGSGRHTWLTESDVLILTIAGSVMTLLSFVIMGICLFSSKLDDDRSSTTQRLHQIGHPIVGHLSTEGKFRIPPGMTVDLGKDSKGRPIKGGGRVTSSKDSASVSRSSSETSRLSKKQSPGTTKRKPHVGHRSRQNIPPIPLSEVKQIIVPLGHPGPVCSLASQSNQNFLMRSPTIRRMHGLASNASDWLKYTLRAYPTDYQGANRSRRRLFIAGQQQLPLDQVTSGGRPRTACKILPAALASGCPLHAFTALQAMKEAAQDHKIRLDSTDCSYCNHLLAAARSTKAVQFEQSNTSGLDDQDKRSAMTSSKLQSNTSKVDLLGNILPTSSSNNVYKMTSQLEDLRFRTHQKFEPQTTMTKASIKQPEQPSLRTFGSQSGGSRSGASSTKNSSTTDLVSQLPTTDVVGRFTYTANDNQVASPINQPPESVLSSETRATSRTEGEGNSIMSASGCEDIFILIADSPDPSNGRSGQAKIARESSLRVNCPDVIQIMPLDSPQLQSSIASVSNLMRNHENVLSSPTDAYEFMHDSSQRSDSIGSHATGPINVQKKQDSDQMRNAPSSHTKDSKIIDSEPVIISRL